MLGDFWGYLGVSRDVWGYLRIFGDTWRWGYLRIFGDMWGYLGVSGKTCGYVGMLGKNVEVVGDTSISNNLHSSLKCDHRSVVAYKIPNILVFGPGYSGS